MDVLQRISEVEGLSTPLTQASSNQAAKWVTAASHHSEWQKVGSAVRAEYVFAELEFESRIQHNLEQDPDVLTEVPSSKAKHAVPLWHQGNATLQRHDVIALRAHLRHHHLIVDELQRWWETALHSRREAGHHDEAQTISHHGDAAPCTSRPSRVRMPHPDRAMSHPGRGGACTQIMCSCAG